MLVAMALASVLAAEPTPATEELVPPAASCPGVPEYPPEELTSRRAGRVVVRVSLDADGAITDVAVASGMEGAFDAAALEAARRCVFTPARQGGTALPSIIEMSVDFAPPPLRAKIEGLVVGELGEGLAGVAVEAAAGQATTDEEGRFLLELDAPESGETWFALTKAGYTDAAFVERIRPGETRQVRWTLAKAQRYETRVVGSRLLPEVPAVDRTPQVSRFLITRADIDRSPGALEDISRVVQTLPGVVADPDLVATFFVRGGGPDEVVFYLDGVPLANPFHLGGFATIYNPMLIESAEFYAGGTPPQYVPSLSGVLDVRYAAGETTRLRAQADVSMNTAKVRVDAPTEIPGVSVTAAARRSYYELYFAGLRAAHVVGGNYVAPDIGEYFLRVHGRTGRHQLMATYLHSTDGLDFIVKPGEEVLVNFAGGLKLLNQVDLGILSDRIDLGAGSELSLLVAGTRDENHTSVSGENVVARDAARQELLARADLTLSFSDQNRLRAGLTFSERRYAFVGEMAESRDVAPWSARPMVDTGAAMLEINPVTRGSVLAAYAEHTWRPIPQFTVEGGMRLQAQLASARSTYSLRAATSYELPFGTVAKVSFGMATQDPANPLLLDSAFGNPSLDPERSTQVVVGLEQPLPFRAFARVEGFAKWLDHLAANPDSAQGLQSLSAAGEPAYQAVGTGFARGADLMLFGRTKSIAYGLAAGLVFSDRTNPLAGGVRTYPSPWDQRFTASANVSWAPGASWLLSARLSFHTGRPYTPVVDFALDPNTGKYLPVFGPTNSERYPPFYELSLRAEKRFTLGPVSAAVYAEVLNVTNAQNVFVYIYGADAQDAEADRQHFNHLPVRPFLGIRAEY